MAYSIDSLEVADEKKAAIEAGKGSPLPNCDKEKVDEFIASVMKEAGVS